MAELIDESLIFSGGAKIELLGSDVLSITNSTLDVAGNTVLTEVNLGYTESGRNYPVELSNNKMYVNVPWSNTQLSTESVQDIVGAMVTGNTETNISVTYNDDNGKLNFVATDTNTQLSTESVQDIVGAMVTGNTETNITVTYNDDNGKLNFASTNTTYGTANSNTSGLIKIGFPESGRDYPVELNTSGQAYVNVPWTDTNTTDSLIPSLSSTNIKINSSILLEESTDRSDLLQITGLTSGYAGLQIRNSSNEGRWSFMTDGEGAGMYNDEDNQWHIYMGEKSYTRLYHAGSTRLETLSDGVYIYNKGYIGGTSSLGDGTNTKLQITDSSHNYINLTSTSDTQDVWNQTVIWRNVPKYTNGVDTGNTFAFNTWRIGTYDQAAGMKYETSNGSRTGTTGMSLYRIAGKNRASNSEINYIVCGPRGDGWTDRTILYNPYVSDSGDYNGTNANDRIYHDGYHPTADYALNADKLDGVSSGSFVRSDANDSKSAGYLRFYDNVELNFGTGHDFKIKFDGADTVFRNYVHSGGNIYFQGEDPAGANHALIYMYCDKTGGGDNENAGLDAPHVRLYYDAVQMLRTTAGGAMIGDPNPASTATEGAELQFTTLSTESSYSVDTFKDTSGYLGHGSDQWVWRVFGTSTGNGQSLSWDYTNGVLRSTGDIIAYSSSDARLKNDLKPIDDSLTRLLNLTGYTFTWDETKQATYTGQDIGVVAQEIEQQFPEVVRTNKDGYKSVKYDKLVPVLIESIKTQQSQLDKQQQQIEQLLKRVEQLEK